MPPSEEGALTPSSESESEMGRRTKCTPERTRRVCEMLVAGNFPEIAAQMAGISRRSYFAWRARGEKELERVEEEGGEIDEREQPYVDFLDATDQANAQAEAASIVRIQQIARDKSIDVRYRLDAEKFLLERRFRDRWGTRKIDVEVEGKVDTEVVYKMVLPDPGHLHERDDEPSSEGS